MSGSGKAFSPRSKPPVPPTGSQSTICNVWDDNFLQEVANIRALAPLYSCLTFVF